MFPQVYGFVQQFVSRRVIYNGIDPKELGLQKYITLVVERLRDAIYPDESAGEPPLLPILNRYRPVGSTAGVDFTTIRPTTPATKSHINSVVIDSGFEKDEWEKKAVMVLEATELVSHYARNDHLGLVIPYRYLDVDYSYHPDFIVRLTNGLMLLLEIKGYERDKEKNNAKNEAARRWVTAVNNLEDFGQWAFWPCHDLDLLLPKLGELVGQEVAAISLQSDGDLF
jgi:type III restriction enzyme